MAVEVKVPQMGESITSGILASWRVKDGDTVSQDQALYDLETDKITSEGLAPAAGTIRLKASEGDEVEIGQVVAVVEESSEGTSPGDGAKAKHPEGDAPDEPKAKEEPKGEDKPKEDKAPAQEESEKAEKKPAEGQPGPAARKLAEEKGVDLDSIEGSGKGGRVTKGDVLSAADRATAQQPESAQKPEGSPEAKATDGEPAQDKPVAKAAEGKDVPLRKEFRAGGTAQAQPQQPPATEQKPKADKGERVTRKKMSPLRKRVAERLVQAQQTAAILTTFNEADMSAIMSLRKQHQDRFVDKHGIKLGFMSFFVKAAVYALKEVPAINAQIEGDEVLQNHYYDIGVAVSTPRGLMVPVIRDADSKDFAQIEKDIAEYGKKAKEGKITIEDLQGGVFTISNGGIFGSMLSTPILNTPQSGILGMHAIQERPVARDGQVVIRPMMYLALSYDHRLVDGREAVTFLIRMKEVLEDPARLLFGV